MSNVISFGCRLNQSEGDLIKEIIAKSDMPKKTFVINTCAVTQEAEKAAKRQIRRLARNIPDANIMVTGCSAQINPDQYKDMPNVTKIIGNTEKLSPEYYTADQSIIVGDIMKIEKIAPHMVECFTEKTRAFIEVQNGCNHRCTFCQIPFGRGNSRSAPLGLITNRIKHMLDLGYKEIILTGIDLTAYGQDLPGKPTFAQMIRRLLNQLPAIERLRLSSVDVAEIDDDLKNIIINEPRFMPHIHISVQAGHNMILKRMKRRHNREQVIEFCNEVQEKRPGITFGADMIVGFPTETDEMFQASVDLLKDSNIMRSHIFPFSAHPNIPASRMPQVDQLVIKERARILRDVAEELKQKNYNDNMHKDVKVLVEQRKNNHYFGYAENYIPVRIPAAQLQESDVGTVKTFRTTQNLGKYLIAAVSENQEMKCTQEQQ